LEVRAEVFNATNKPPLPGAEYHGRVGGIRHDHGGWRPSRRPTGSEVLVLKHLSETSRHISFPQPLEERWQLEQVFLQ
jgi:hypothetical protein